MASVQAITLPSPPPLQPQSSQHHVACQIPHCGILLDVRDKKATRNHVNFHVNSLAWGESLRGQCPWEGCTTELQKKSMCKHVVNVHCGADRQTCDLCGLRVSTSDALVRHQEAACRGTLGDGDVQN